MIKNYRTSRQTQMQPTINEKFYNPYSFIPLSGQVFRYSEEEKKRFLFANVIPFHNGISGKITASFKAETPFCVRSSTGRNCNIENGQFFVPSTSLKGMIRSVFDIITLSNIRNSSENHRFSMRDLRSKDYHLKENSPRSGFLILLRGKYYIIPCESWAIHYDEIQEEEGVDISRIRSIEEKYKALKDGYIFQTDNGLYHYWFFSGYMQNKKHEYDFALPKHVSEKELIPLEEKEYEEFIFIHTKENKNKSWDFWKKEMHSFSSLKELEATGYKGLAPCFFRSKADGEKTCVKDLGFSFLYRMPYQKRVHDCLPNSYQSDGIDMSQALFGYINTGHGGKSDNCLRGRVRFSNAFIENAEQEGEHTFILGSPKPTYYPFYLQQDSKELRTFASERPTISGWKRYLIHKTAQKGTKQGKGSESSFIALKAGTRFTTEIHVHNLQPYEVGALLAALTFFNHQEYFHSLGYAKPFGFGKMRLTDYRLLLESNNKDIKDLLSTSLINEFKEKILATTGITYEAYENYLRPLFKIASGDYTDCPIRYPHLDNMDYRTRKKKSEFEIIKSEKKSINDFTPIR